MKKFIHKNFNGKIDEVVIINDGNFITKRLYTENKEHYLNKLKVNNETINKRFRYKDCIGKVFSTWKESLEKMGYENEKACCKRLKERGYREV
jgi:phosphopantetheinyl transferase (holo-ACP synthase)